MKKAKWEMSLDEFRKEYYDYYCAIKKNMDDMLKKHGYTPDQVVNLKTVDELLIEDYWKIQAVKHQLVA